MSDDKTFDLGEFAKDMIEGVAESVDKLLPKEPVDIEVVRSTGGLGSTYDPAPFKDDGFPDEDSKFDGFMSAPSALRDSPADDLKGTDEDAVRQTIEDGKPPWFDASAPQRLLDEIDHTVNEVVPQFVEDLFVEKDLSDVLDQVEPVGSDPDRIYRSLDPEPAFQGFTPVGGDAVDTLQWKLDGLKYDGVVDDDAGEQSKLDGLKLDGLKDDGLVDGGAGQQSKLDGLSDDGSAGGAFKNDGLFYDGSAGAASKDDGLSDDGSAGAASKDDGLFYDGSAGAASKDDGLSDDGSAGGAFKDDGFKDDGFNDDGYKLDGLELDGLQDDGGVFQLEDLTVDSYASIAPPAGPVPIPYPNVTGADVAEADASSAPAPSNEMVLDDTPGAEFEPAQVNFDPVDQGAVDAVWSGITEAASDAVDAVADVVDDLSAGFGE